MSADDQRYKQAMNLGHSAAWDQEWERAASFYSQALDSIPEDPKALMNLALAFLNMSEYDKALKYYLRAAEIAQDDPVPLEKAATLYESLGQLEKASRLSERGAELYLKEKNPEKAIENWSRAVALFPQNLQAHSRLALVYERLGRKPQAIREFLHVASLLQHAGQREKAFNAANRALKLDPLSKEVQQALELLRAGTLLPKPARPKGGTGLFGKLPTPIKAEVPEQHVDPIRKSDDPIEEARQVALSNLARLFFEQAKKDGPPPAERQGLQAIMKGTGPLFMKNADQSKIMLHLGQVVNLQSQGDMEQAIEELKGAISAGLDAPAAYFSLGSMLAKTGRHESAVRYLERTVSNIDYSLGARLILGGIWYEREKYKQAAMRYLEALRYADAELVVPAQADELHELYEPIVEIFASEKDEQRQKKLCENIAELLVRPNWREHLNSARRQIGEQDSSAPPIPLAEMLLESSSSNVVVAMSTVRSMARAGHIGAALEEVLFALEQAPTYLPLHIVLGDLLLSRDLLAEAAQKFMVVARAYSVRGESQRTIAMLRRVVEMLPMDAGSRVQLIEHLVAWGQHDDAIIEYLNLADVRYSLAEINETRKAYAEALHLATQSSNPDQWRVRIWHRIADLETQSLNWRQAVQLYKQICELHPDDGKAYYGLVSLLFKLQESEQALVSIDRYIETMSNTEHANDVITFLNHVLEEQPAHAMLHYRLAAQYQITHQTELSIQHYDMAGELLIDAGDKAGAAEMISKLIALDPPEKGKYQKLLAAL